MTTRIPLRFGLVADVEHDEPLALTLPIARGQAHDPRCPCVACVQARLLGRS